jgi:(1->4)-alpha-D-glucan 1-alpha-D-glucosylmutase
MRIPAATYRLQFNAEFGFRKAAQIVDYLAQLGISDIYASPIFKAREGSGHGYDVVDPNRLNPELGEFGDFEALIGLLKKHDMGWLQDIVPNHMAFAFSNPMLMDLLENGPGSPYFHFFDIDWDHAYESLRGRLLTPFLGSFYGEALEEGRIKLQYGVDGFAVTYYDWVFPLRIESYADLLTHRLAELKRKLGRQDPDYIKILGLLYMLKTLAGDEERSEREDQIHFIKALLWELHQSNDDVRAFIERNLEIFSGRSGSPETFSLLDNLLARQFFRLSFWKVATEEINYRRFFNINELICLRTENEDVLNRTHTLIFKLLADGMIDGLRVDHIDGLYDPAGYLKALHRKAPDAYLLVEKILDFNESLPESWPVQGSTGYDFLNHVNALFCSRRNEKAFTRIYANFNGLNPAYQSVLSEKKRLIIGKHMAGDVDNLAHLLKGVSSRDRHGRDATLYGLRRGLVEIMAQFPVYRTYIDSAGVRPEDEAYVGLAVERAIANNPELLNELRLIERFLLLKWDDYLSDEEKEQWLVFALRFQQFTGPLMAKGFEDTTLYVYNRLLSLNEVGGDPGRFGITVADFHGFNRDRAEHWLYKLNATSTHDTKRGEDVRARLNVLSEMPREWEKHVKGWRRINNPHKQRVKRLIVPTRNDEYLLYQTLIGAFPFEAEGYPEFVERIKAYVIKAVREAKVHTAWLAPDSYYEEAFLAFVDRILSDEGADFLADFGPFQQRVAFYGIWNSLSQTLLKIAAPGVPDFYQGTELWDLNLVDPDNRRPVDYENRRRWLAAMQDRSRADLFELIATLLRRPEDGRIKLFLIHRALQARRSRGEMFREGGYIPLGVRGRYRDHVVAFGRRRGPDHAIAVAPRLLSTLISEGEQPLGPEVWADTRVAVPRGWPAGWMDVIAPRSVTIDREAAVGDLLQYFPTALLFSETSR